MAACTVNTVGYQTYNLERNKNAPDISSDTDVLLMFNLELNKVSWISAWCSCSYILLTLNYCCHSSFSRKYEPVNGFTLFPLMIETQKDWKNIYKWWNIEKNCNYKCIHQLSHFCPSKKEVDTDIYYLSNRYWPALCMNLIHPNLCIYYMLLHIIALILSHLK